MTALQTTGPREPSVDSDRYRDAISRFASGVTVITTAREGQDYGTTVSAVSSLSLDPPMLLVCLNRSSSTQAAIAEAGVFGVNVLGEAQADVATRFATKDDRKFEALPIDRGAFGMPLIPDAIARFECRVAEQAVGGTHTVFLAHVVSADTDDGAPLTYYRGRFGRFENSLQERAYTALRERVLQRSLPLDRALDLEELSLELDADVAQLYYAATRLIADGVVERRDDGRLFVTPLDFRTAAAALDARCAVELSIADEVIAGASDRLLARLVRSAEEAGHAASVDSPDLDVFLAAAREFHDQYVALSSNPYLVDFHRRLGVHGIWGRLLAGTDWPAQIDPARFARVARALRDRDADAARAAIASVTAELKSMAGLVIERAGGRV